eukprot:TRINITY_DN2130_c0_g1_i1.p1 TRINITY_DN2130_c0_g1~~TRINITY_DN2130_c0_g1_i1.p1  ORF type:complete len:316 (-),score=38.97 TRINITY_DN2130_c0_g1_i1:207-1154(-)
MNSLTRILYKSLYRTCQKFDRSIPRSRHVFWHSEDVSMVQALREKTRKLPATTEVRDYGFKALRELRSDYESSLRWYNVLHDYTNGCPIPIESGAIAIAKVANPSLDTELVTRKLDHLASLIRFKLEEQNLVPLPVFEKTDIGEEQRVQYIKGCLRVINQIIFEHMGFSGHDALQNDDEDPRDTLIDGVLVRKCGIPISLSIIYMSQAQRLGIHLEGFRLPGHFIVGYLSEVDEKYSFFIDVNNKGSFHTLPDLQHWLKLNGIAFNSLPKYTSPCTLPQIYYTLIEDLLNKYLKHDDLKGTEKLRHEKDALEPYV